MIGWDSRFPEPAKVLSYSLKKHASEPLDVRFLDLRHLEDCYGFRPHADPRATTEFTRSRFLVPWLCGYEGFAVFSDNDVLCLGDVVPLFKMAEQDPEPKALYVVKHDHQVVDGSLKMGGVVQTSYARKNWSSVMVMNCAKLKCWTRELVETAEPKRLHRFEDVPDDQIGEIGRVWNSLDHMTPSTRLLHWTSGMLWNDKTKTWPHQDLWLRYRKEWLASEDLDPRTPVRSQVG